MYRQRVTNPLNPLLPVNIFGTTHVRSYDPGYSPAFALSDYCGFTLTFAKFPAFRPDNALSQYVKERANQFPDPTFLPQADRCAGCWMPLWPQVVAGQVFCL